MTSKAVLYDRGSPTIVIINESTDVTDRELTRLVRVLQKQIDRDFFPLWGWRAKLVQRTRLGRTRAMVLTIKNEPEEGDEGTAGYHFIEGLPMTYVFTRDEKGNRVGGLGATMSHELLEMIADPAVNLYAMGYYRKSGRRYAAFIPYEVCDPVQENTYLIDGVRVSDFVVPEWFEMEREPKSMKFNFLGTIDEPFALAPGGYTDAMVGGSIRTQWGEEANKKKRRHRRKIRTQRT